MLNKNNLYINLINIFLMENIKNLSEKEFTSDNLM